MTSIIQWLFHPLPNAIMTVLLGLSALYWLLTFIAGDFLGDIDLEPDLGIDMDSDLGGEVAAEPSIFQKALSFINVGKVPIMLVMSMFKFIAWLFSLATTMIWNISNWGWKSGLILLPIFIITFFLTKWATQPFIKIYKQMGYNGEIAHDLIGRIAVLKSSIKNDTLGTAELTIQHDVLKVMVKSKTGTPIDFNATVTIVAESKDKSFYWVIPEINLNNVI